MTTKIVIQELISKYTFEVDKSGAEEYQKALSDGDDAALGADKSSKKLEKTLAGTEKEAKAAAGAVDKAGDEIKQTGDQSDTAAKKVGKLEAGFDKAAEALVQFGPQAAAGAAIAGLAILAKGVEFVGEKTAELDAIAKSAQKSGLGFEEFQQLSHFAGLAGTEVGVVDKAINKLNLDMSLGLPDTSKKALAELGLEASQLDGKGPTEQLSIIAGAMAGIEGEADKARVAFQLLGEDGKQLIPLFNGGAEAIDAMAASTGKIFTREELAKAEAYQDQLAEINKAVSDVAGEFAIALAPALGTVVDAARETLPKVIAWIKETWARSQPLIDRFVELGNTIKTQLQPVFERLYAALVPVMDILGDDMPGGLGALIPLIETAAAQITFFANQLSFFLEIGVSVYSWITSLLDTMEERWPRAFEVAAGVVNALLHPLDTARDVVRDFFNWIEKSVSKIAGLGAKIREIKASLGLGSDDNSKIDLAAIKASASAALAARAAGLVDAFADGKTAKDVAAADNDKAIAARERQIELAADASAEAEDAAKGGKGGKGGGKAAATGLEAQIEAQFKEAAARAEVGASARALQEGKSGKDAFALGREAAKQTEERLRRNFENTGALPEGIARDVESLARSPAVEDSIGRVPPPVITVTNNVTNVTVSGNDFQTSVEASLSGVTVSELTQATNRATMRMVKQELGEAVANLMPRMRV